MHEDRELEMLEEELRRRLRLAMKNYLAEHPEELDMPPLDLSFLDSDPTQDSGAALRPDTSDPSAAHIELQPDPTETVPAPRLRTLRLRNIAAVFLAVFVLSGAMAVWINSNTASALKFRVDKIIHETVDHRYSTDAEADSTVDSITLHVTDPADLETIRRQVPGMLVPETLPEGYAFSFAEMEKQKAGNYGIHIEYCNNEIHDSIAIDESICREEGNTELLPDAGSIELPNRKVYYARDDLTDEHFVAFYENDLLIQISGSINKETLLKMANGMHEIEV